MPTPLTDETNPGQPQVLTQEEIQALWAAESERRKAGTPVPTPEEQAAQDAAAATGDKPADAAQGDKGGEPAAAKDDKSKDAAKPAADEDPLAKRLDALEQGFKRTEGRVAAMQREQATAAKKATEKVDDAPSQAQQAAALKDPEKWAALKKDFPEWGEAISEFVSANLGQKGPAAEDIEQLVTARVEAREQAREIRYLERKHPDWQEVRASEEFLAWRKTQSEAVNSLASSPYAEDAIEMFDLYKASQKPAPARDVQAERAAKLAAAAAPQRASRAAPTPKGDSELTPNEIWRQEAERRKKARLAA